MLIENRSVCLLVSLSNKPYIYWPALYSQSIIDSKTLCFRTVRKYNPYISFLPVNCYLFGRVCRCIMKRQILYQIRLLHRSSVYYLDIKMSVNLKIHKITAIDHTTSNYNGIYLSNYFCRNRTLYPFSSCSKLCSCRWWPRKYLRSDSYRSVIIILFTWQA